jgi:tripartite-type tricarboxylate transporter receptor subunit TctC
MPLRRNHVPLDEVYAALPNLASAHEHGLADFEAPTWFTVFPRRGASEPVIRKLNHAAFATADTPSVQKCHTREFLAFADMSSVAP